jgi:hypothetical protein
MYILKGAECLVCRQRVARARDAGNGNFGANPERELNFCRRILRLQQSSGDSRTVFDKIKLPFAKSAFDVARRSYGQVQPARFGCSVAVARVFIYYVSVNHTYVTYLSYMFYILYIIILYKIMSSCTHTIVMKKKAVSRETDIDRANKQMALKDEGFTLSVRNDNGKKDSKKTQSADNTGYRQRLS